MANAVDFDIAAGQVVTFRAGSITGVRLDRSHATYLDELHHDPDVMAFVGGVRPPEVSTTWLDLNIDHWRRHDFGQWLLYLDGTPIGRGGLRWIDDCVGEQLVEVGYMFEREAWGQGHATEVTAAFITLAEDHYRIDELGA
ncbi:MAG: GNAT family N-acetyltransferase, partial [Acidimicrobiales bacterium]